MADKALDGTGCVRAENSVFRHEGWELDCLGDECHAWPLSRLQEEGSSSGNFETHTNFPPSSARGRPFATRKQLFSGPEEPPL